jgi:hypothetical protein
MSQVKQILEAEKGPFKGNILRKSIILGSGLCILFFKEGVHVEIKLAPTMFKTLSHKYYYNCYLNTMKLILNVTEIPSSIV